MEKRDFIVNKIISLTSASCPNSEVYLYGSRARRDEKKASDWDLLILLKTKKVSFDFETRLMDDFYELELETGEIFSPLIYSKHEWEKYHAETTLYENIQRDGIRLK